MTSRVEFATAFRREVLCDICVKSDWRRRQRCRWVAERKLLVRKLFREYRAPEHGFDFA